MKKQISRAIALALVAGGVTTTASAQTLSTLFASNNGGNAGGAVFFDIVVGPSPITITGMDVNTGDAAGTKGFTMYTHTGTYLGTETTAAAWTVATTGTVAATGVINTPSPVTFGSAVVLAANTTYGVALSLADTGQTSAAHSYTNGTGANQTYSNADLTLNLGAAQNVPFTGAPFTPRVWNGTVNYSIGGTLGACCLPAPSYLCIQTTSTNCAAQTGTYAGDNVTCAAANCPPAPTGACCNPASGCSIMAELACTTSGGVYGGNNVACGVNPCLITVWQESGDAGELPAGAQIVVGTGTVTQIRGSFTASDVDMYQINICDAANFSATTVGLTTIDTQLWIFKSDGTGVVCNDDAVGLQSSLTALNVAPAGNGLYYLANSVFNRDPAGVTTSGLIWNTNNPEPVPDGPAAAEAIGSWLNATGTTGNYAIALTGTCFIGGDFGACCLGAPTYSCSVQSPAGCAAAGGTYAGNNVTCAAANCPPPPTGACCTDTGCSVLTQAACLAASGTYAGDNVTCAAANCPPTGACCIVGACSTLTSAACVTAGGTWQAVPCGAGVCPVVAWNEVGDAGDTPATAQDAVGVANSPLLRISGTIDAGNADVFRFNICDEANFSATTVGGAAFDTQLSLFSNTGLGVTFCDDVTGATRSTITSTFVTANGDYYVGVSAYDNDAVDAGALELWIDTPFVSERAPDGPGAANAWASYTVAAVTAGTYNIDMTGACFYPAAVACYANCDLSTATPILTANDFQCFLNKYAANDPTANCDGSTGNPLLTANDFQCFLNAYAAGCT